MKTIKTLTLVIFAIALSCTAAKAQAFASLGVGGNVIVKAPVIELQAGYMIRSWSMQAGFQTHIDNFNPGLFQTRIGRRFTFPSGSGVHLSAGYCYSLTSSDDKARNRRLFIGGVDYFLPIGAGENAEVVFGLSATKGNAIVTVSMRGLFSRKN